jgi:hypothetical protein
MHTYRKSGDEWTVGFCIPGSGEAGLPWWQTIRDFQSEAEAAAYVSFLNGGKVMTTQLEIQTLLEALR